MKLPLLQSKYLWVKDGYVRMFIRWLFINILDEPYLPEGGEIIKLHSGTVVLRWHTTKKRRGMCEEYIPLK